MTKKERISNARKFYNMFMFSNCNKAAVVIKHVDSTYDLGVYYIDNVVGTLDHHVSAVLDYAELGKEIADTDDEYLLLTSGRIIEFKM